MNAVKLPRWISRVHGEALLIWGHWLKQQGYSEERQPVCWGTAIFTLRVTSAPCCRRMEQTAELPVLAAKWSAVLPLWSLLSRGTWCAIMYSTTQPTTCHKTLYHQCCFTNTSPLYLALTVTQTYTMFKYNAVYCFSYCLPCLNLSHYWEKNGLLMCGLALT